MSIVRTRHQKLSLWQSSVAEVVQRTLASSAESVSSVGPSPLDVYNHPMVLATNDFVRNRLAKADPVPTALQLTDPHVRNVHVSGLAFDIADARAEGRVEDEHALRGSWPFSDDDPKFLECAAVYAAYWKQYGGTFVYHDWRSAGSGSIDYGIIQWKLPNDARVAIIGDWGTGMDDAVCLLRDLMVQHTPHVILHLGDIYYSGTPTECVQRFEQCFTQVFNEVLGPGKRIPVFTIPGNHDYYALGYGFYPMLANLNSGLAGADQPASYFCLRTEDGGWQFLAMDTGYEDANPTNQINPAYAGPWLQPSELTWHRNKLDNFGGATILLSHHQVFTANARINGMASSQSEFPYLNPNLMNAFQPYFRSRVAAWLWGHEHNFVLFENGLFGLAKGRLLGASAFEEMVSENPYDVKYPNVKYLDPSRYRLSRNDSGYYAHSYAIIDLSGRAKPTDPVSVTYYEFPSWYDAKPTNPASKVIYAEHYSLPTPTPGAPINYGDAVHLSVEGGLVYLAGLSGTAEYYPTVGAKPVALRVLSATNSRGPITNGAAVILQTTEVAAGAYNLLGAWSTHWLYYYKPGYSQQKWIVAKLDTTQDNVIRYGDAVSFVSQAFQPQTICPTGDGYFTTTTAKPSTLFVLENA